MKNKYYTSERGQQILIAVLKANGIKKVVASPGTTNMTLVASMQQDTFFEMYSSIDERSAAYIACGLAAESGEPVVLTCTEATASRNYMPGLTEAFYRKLPVLAVTGTHGEYLIGQFEPQVIDRRNVPNDVANLSVRINPIKDTKDEWSATLKINQAVLELKHRGGGPVHIDLATTESKDFSVEHPKPVQIIKRYTHRDQLPKIPSGKIGVFIGAHKRFSDDETAIIDAFCASNNAVVFCDQTSNYYGQYRINYSIVASQEKYWTSKKTLDLMIHIGEVSGEYWHVTSKNTWRVHEDGIIRDLFRGTLSSVFEMTEREFFSNYIQKAGHYNSLYFEFKKDCDDAYNSLPDLPFSNAWIASILYQKMPNDCILHYAILNSLRAWNFFDTPQAYMTSSNVGGFGIDGCLSTLVGASLANPDKLHFAFTGDLAFFYDMNVLGNRHIGSNVRILVVNNGKGTEFRMYWHPAFQFGDDADKFIAAGGHYGDKSHILVKNYVEALGYKYIKASTKQEFIELYPEFISPKQYDNPIVFEVFTNSEDENNAVELIRNMMQDSGYPIRHAKHNAKVVAQEVINEVKKIIK